MARNKQEHLEMELLQYKKQVSSLQDRLDSVTKVWREEQGEIALGACEVHHCLSLSLFFFIQEFDMSVEDLSETLLQIKVGAGFVGLQKQMDL